MDSIKEKKRKYRESNSEYFEAILQLRGFSDKDIYDIVDYIEANECRISKEVIEKDGVDFYLFSQKFIQKLARWIKERYNCIINITSTLHTRDTKANKDLFRLTVYARFLPFKIGDIIDYKGERVKITSSGEKVSGKNEKTGKRIFIDLNQINFN
ncbi:MAG: NMD3-related protein [Candidatus Woesearchaeota archaeon]